MNLIERGGERAVTFAAITLLATALAGCSASRVDDVAVKWPSFKDNTQVLLPSDPAQCPDLSGIYRAQGERRAGDADAFLLEDLRGFLLYPLDLPGMRDAPAPAWKLSSRSTVTFVADARGWQIETRDGQGAREAALLALHDGGASAMAAGGEAMRPGNDIWRAAGCTQGRLWISVRHDWRQHESMGVRRHVAVLRKDAGGLLLTVQRESDSIGMLLPWYTNTGDSFQYWFAPAIDHP
ncbi:hypothetical protein [Achromobacter sp.]|uniref:hypothetical protein n=1 Tax=Achromobacter sp. TaxID=134375 RepID=UPI0028A2599A|nr:hypothetical protein [Achromobacter sp.]